MKTPAVPFQFQLRMLEVNTFISFVKSSDKRSVSMMITPKKAADMRIGALRALSELVEYMSKPSPTGSGSAVERQVKEQFLMLISNLGEILGFNVRNEVNAQDWEWLVEWSKWMCNWHKSYVS